MYKRQEKGYKVAVCEQVEDPKTARGMVKREVVRLSLIHIYPLVQKIVQAYEDYEKKEKGRRKKNDRTH